MVSLKQFVADAITQIVEGVVEAQKNVKESRGIVNPTNVYVGNTFRDENCQYGETGNVVQRVSFDVAITAEEGSAAKGGISVLGGLVNVGGAGQSDSKSSAASRVQFTVPLLLPPGDA